METPALAAFEQSEERCLVPLRRNRARAPLEELISGEFNYIKLNEDDFPDGKFVPRPYPVSCFGLRSAST